MKKTTKRKKNRFLRKLRAPFNRLFRFLLVVLLGYLCQVSVMPYLAVSTITPNLMLVVCAVTAVCYGKLRAYWVGTIYGVLMETMLPTLKLFSLLVYPIVSLFSSVFFCDKSDKALEEARSMNRAAKNGNVYVRTVACTALESFIFNLINVIYIYLGGTTITMLHIRRGLGSVAYTALIAALLVYPLRTMLGFRHPRREEVAVSGRYLAHE